MEICPRALVDGDIRATGQKLEMRRKLLVALFIAILMKAHLLGRVRQTALASPRCVVYSCFLLVETREALKAKPVREESP